MIKKRIEEIDILRGIAFLAVVLQHVLASYIYEPTVNEFQSISSALILNLARFAVPLFVFLTGFSLYYSSNKYSYGTFMKKRFKQIILPYLVWSLLYDVFMFFLNGMKTKSIVDLLGEYVNYALTGTAFYHLWYMIMIIQFYLMFPVFKKIINKGRKFLQNTIVMLLFLILQVVLLWIYNNYAGIWYENSTNIVARYLLAYRDRLFIMWMFYFVLGAYCSIYFEEFKKIVWKIRYLSGVVFLASLTYIMYLMITTHKISPEGGYIINHNLGSPLNFTMFIFLVASILVLYPVSQVIDMKSESLKVKLINIGKYSFGGYLVHAFILHYLNFILKMTVPGFYFKIIIAFVLCSFISIYFTKFISKLNNKYTNVLIGQTNRPNKK